MVLRLKAWKSRALPGLKNTDTFDIIILTGVAGWSSLVARQAHNLKVVGSNPTPATNLLVKKLKNFILQIKIFF